MGDGERKMARMFGGVFQPVFSQQSGWVLGVVIAHQARPLDRDEIDQLIAWVADTQEEARARREAMLHPPVRSVGPDDVSSTPLRWSHQNGPTFGPGSFEFRVSPDITADDVDDIEKMTGLWLGQLRRRVASAGTSVKVAPTGSRCHGEKSPPTPPPPPPPAPEPDRRHGW